MNEIYTFFKQNFPYVCRNEAAVKNILENENTHIFEKRNLKNELTACAVINLNAILLLAVDKNCRNKGIGSELLEKCEQTVALNGFDKIVLGAGFDYFMPGVPTSRKYAESVNENLCLEVNEIASNFFEKRGYIHSWKNCNCFDMKLPLKDMIECCNSIGDTINGVLYRWADIDDMNAVCSCADDACSFSDDTFSVYYKNSELYKKDGNEKVLVAEKNNEIAGALIVSVETEGKDLGSVGCTCVAVKEWKQGIAKNMVKLGTKYLRDLGLSNACLNYTYSGLDKMYGEAGYKISTYYFMGEKTIKQK